MKPKFLQFNCLESDKIDLRQANAILKHRPDIVILEYPCNTKFPYMELNKFPAIKKPKQLIKQQISKISTNVLKIHPWAEGDIVMWKNIDKLWKENHQSLVYPVDAPTELTSELLDVWRHTYPCVTKNWVWWVQIYLREKMMANNIGWILSKYKAKNDPVVLIFLQSFHWDHVKFLLSKPSQKKIWEYYFARFPEINKNTIGPKIKKLNKIFYKYWLKFSDF